MKRFTLLLLLFTWLSTSAFSQSTALYRESTVSSIYIFLPADSLNYMIDNLLNDEYLHATFVFDDNHFRDTVMHVGIRLRGNTSLYAEKKSFKISFNEFVPGREYQGVRKLNLRGQHNDPTMIREKLFYNIWKKAGMPERRTAFVKLYINNQYRGLYTNAEEMDKIWLDRVYGNNDGNFYKCTYPADLVYQGSNQQTYKSIMNDPITRAYELTTNEVEDDYSRLVELITALNQPVTADFPQQISQILNVESVLKSFAIDVVTGNWDDYFYNKNNYYLYDNPATGRFEFITFDTDNTFGVDFLGRDWAKRDCLAWQHPSQPRPLATKLLQVPAFREQYIHYLDSITRFIALPDSIFPRIDVFHDLIAAAAAIDEFRTLDYGYTFGDFNDGFVETVDAHTPYGIKPFLGLRADSTFAQLGLPTATTESEVAEANISVYPNPLAGQLYVHTNPAFFRDQIQAVLLDAAGRPVAKTQWMASQTAYEWALPGDLPRGWYLLRVTNGAQTAAISVVKQ